MKKSILLFGLVLGAGCGPNVHETSLNSVQTPSSIVGGHIVAEESFAKHIVAIRNDVRNFWCTGTLISSDTVLTAAHCLNQGSRRDYKIYFSKNPRTQREHTRDVEDLKFHAQYNAKAYDDRNDVAVLRFGGSLPAGFEPMALPTLRDLATGGRDFFAAGYGTVTARKQANDGSGVLRYTSQKIVGAAIEPGQTQFLVDQTNGHGICFGDSGGPAFIRINNRFVILGIASAVYTLDKEEKAKPGFDACRYNAIYTSVFHYLDWIEKASAEIH